MAYSAPALPLAMLGAPLIVFLPNLYATSASIELATVGAIFFFARIWDALADIVIGVASDRTRSPWGKRKPWIALATPVLAVSVFFLLIPGAHAGPVRLFCALVITYTAWASVQIPYSAWGVAISRDYAERGRIFGLRELATVLGSLATIVLPYLATGIPSPPLPVVLEILCYAIVGLLIITVAVALFGGPAIEETETSSARPLDIGGLFSIVRNRPFLVLLASYFLGTVGLFVFTAGILFFLTKALLLQAFILPLLLLQQVATLASVPVVMTLSSTLGRPVVLACGLLAIALGLAVLMVCQPGNIAQVAIALVFIGCAAGAFFVVSPALAADCVDYGALRGLNADAGLYMAIFSFVGKVGAASAVGLAFPALHALGFDPAADASLESVRALRSVSLAAPIVVLITAGALAWLHPIDRRRHGIVVQRLKAIASRRAAYGGVL